MKTILPFLRLILLVTLATSVPLPAAEKGTLGLGLNVKLGGDGSIISFRVASAAIKSIKPNSPAAGHDMAVGDLLVEVDGLVVAGCKGLALKEKLTVPPGNTVKLKLKRTNGEVYAVELTASPNPK